jgi:hypothetical protein
MVALAMAVSMCAGGALDRLLWEQPMDVVEKSRAREAASVMQFGVSVENPLGSGASC